MKLKRVFSALLALCLCVGLAPVLGRTAEAAEAESERGSAKYTITVDITNQIVTVYDNGNTTDSGIVRQMICSTGKNATPTPTGTYTLPKKTRASERTEWYYFSEYNCYAKWATRIVGGILFHSVLFNAHKVGPTSSSVNALGSKASHGCVRLRVDDARWIALNCPAGTKCKIYNSGTVNKDLRQRLLKKSFDRSVQTYDSFMDREPGTAAPTVKIKLSKGSKGPLVTQLQQRLRGLGFLGGAADGKFGSATKTAVQQFQQAMGLKKTGKVDNALWALIFDPNAPTATLATLSPGWEGPAVAVLQTALGQLKFFEGPADGVYGSVTADAVARYQQSFGFAVTGAATGEMQADAIARAASVREQFGDQDYQMVTVTAEVQMATINVKRYTRLRGTPSKKGKNLGKLLKGEVVQVLEIQGSWSKVLYGNKVGYVESKYLSLYTGTQVVVSYEAVPCDAPADEAPAQTPDETPTETPDDTAVAAPGLTLEEEPAETPVEEHAETPAEAPVEEPAETPAEAPVEVPAEAPAEEPVEAPAEEPVEVRAEMPAEAPAEAPEAEALPRYAVTGLGGARLYAEANAQDAQPVAELGEGVALEVVGAVEGWIAALYEGREVWLPADQVTLTDELPAIEGEETGRGLPVLEPGTEIEDAPAEIDGALEATCGLEVIEETPEP